MKLDVEQTKHPKAKFRFSSVYKDPRGNFKRKDLGKLFIEGTVRNYRESKDD